MPTEESRDGLIRHLAADGIVAPFHYIPLDTSAAGVRYGRTPEPCVRSAEFSASILRLPLWPMLTSEQQERVIGSVLEYKQA